MKTLLVLILALGTVILAETALGSEQLSRDEQLALTSRTYNKSAGEIFTAVEKLFRLADKPSDLTITYPDTESMIVVRRASAVLLRTQYRWVLSAKSDANATTLTLSLNTAASGIMRLPSGGTPTVSPDVIGLFYRRLDYLLGQRDTWSSCGAYRKQHPDHSVMDALCLAAEDKNP